jgi:hypothetical protein
MDRPSWCGSRLFYRLRRKPGALIAGLERWLGAADVTKRPVGDWLRLADAAGPA